MADSPPASPDPAESADESEAPVREEEERDGSIFGVFGEKDNDDAGTAVGTSEGMNPPLVTYGGGTADDVKVKARRQLPEIRLTGRLVQVMDVVPTVPGGDAAERSKVERSLITNDLEDHPGNRKKKALKTMISQKIGRAAGRARVSGFDDIRTVLHKDTFIGKCFHKLLSSHPKTAKACTYWTTHVIQLATFQWALGAISASTSSQDELYQRLTTYYQNMGIMAMFFMGISTAFYIDGVIYLSDEDAPVFSRIIVATILLQLAVTFICSFFLIGLCTIDSYKTSIFFESIRSSAQILEFAWLASILAFVVSLYWYVQCRSEDIGQDIDFLFWPLALGSILLLWIMVHRLRSQIWHGEDFLVGFDVGSLLHLLDYYIKEDIRDGQLNLHVDEFRGYVMRLAKDELKKDGADDVVVNGATFNQMTGERIDRIWETLKRRLLDFEFLDLEGKEKPSLFSGNEHADLMNEIVRCLANWERTTTRSRGSH